MNRFIFSLQKNKERKKETKFKNYSKKIDRTEEAGAAAISAKRAKGCLVDKSKRFNSQTSPLSLSVHLLSYINHHLPRVKMELCEKKLE